MAELKRKFHKYGLTLVILVIFALFFQYNYLNKLIVNQKKTNIMESQSYLKTSIEEKLKHYIHYISVMEDLVKSGYTEDQLKVVFNNVDQEENDVQVIYYIDSEKNITYSEGWDWPEEYDPTTRDWYRHTMEDKDLVISHIYSKNIEESEIITISKAVYNIDGDFLGIVAEDIEIGEILDLIEDRPGNRPGKSFLLDGNRNPYGDKSLKLILNQEKIKDGLISELSADKERENIKEISLDETQGYITYNILQNPDWILASFVSLEEFRGDNNDILNLLLIWVFLSAVIIAIFAYILNVHILKPFSSFYYDVMKINEEDSQGYRLPQHKGDPFAEIRLLANSIIKNYEELLLQHQYDNEEIRAKNQELESSYLQLQDMEEKLRTNYQELYKSREDLKELSYRDKLTGLYNRRYFEEKLKELDREENLPLSIIMADINGLKLVNDSFGHDIGDRLIATVGRIIKLGVRGEDIVARVSGDEFLILLPNIDKKLAQRILDRIKSISRTTSLDKAEMEDMEYVASFGLATKENMDTDIDSVLKRAEEKMYDYKMSEGSDRRLKTLDSMIKSLHEKSNKTKYNASEVAKYSVLLGKELNMSEEDLETLKDVSYLIDIGKITISEELLQKKDELSESESQQIKRHPEIGYRILNTIDEMKDLAHFILYHHERYDGKGYPKGLTGEEIPLISRIINICDSYVNMRIDKPYRNALSQDEIVREFIDKAGSQFDPKLARIFVEHVLELDWKI